MPRAHRLKNTLPSPERDSTTIPLSSPVTSDTSMDPHLQSAEELVCSTHDSDLESGGPTPYRVSPNPKLANVRITSAPSTRTNSPQMSPRFSRTSSYSAEGMAKMLKELDKPFDDDEEPLRSPVTKLLPPKPGIRPPQTQQSQGKGQQTIARPGESGELDRQQLDADLASFRRKRGEMLTQATELESEHRAKLESEGRQQASLRSDLAKQEILVERLRQELKISEQQMEEARAKLSRSKTREAEMRDRIAAHEVQCLKAVEQQRQDLIKRATATLEATIQKELDGHLTAI